MDVVTESDAPPSTKPGARVSPPFSIRTEDIEALRHRVESRPSLPVRAGRAAKDKSPWIVVGMLVVEVIRYVLSSL